MNAKQAKKYETAVKALRNFILSRTPIQFQAIVEKAQRDEGAIDREVLLTHLFSDDGESQLDRLWGDVFSSAPLK